jgi:hypothetical protein
MLKQKKNQLLNPTKASITLEKLGEKPSDGKTTISELLEDFSENGLLLALIFFSLPVAVPLPYPPGFTTVMGTPLMILSFQMLLGYHKVKLPQKINQYEMKNSMLIAICNKVVPLLKYLENYIKPRFSFARSFYCEQFIGLVSLICAISVAIPLPLTNAVPALSITIMCLGLLNRDGLVIIFGFIIGIIGLIIAAGALIGSWIGIKYLYHLIF